MNAHILVVCTANVCRSPLAEQLLRARLADWAPGALTVFSAGTHAAYNHSICPEADRILGRARLETSVHNPRQLTQELVTDAQLILTADRDHRAAVARLAPEARWCTFTLREAAALAGVAFRAADPWGKPGPAVDHLADFVDHLNRTRGLAEPTFDIADGHGYGARRHRSALQEVDSAVADIAAGLSRYGTIAPD